MSFSTKIYDLTSQLRVAGEQIAAIEVKTIASGVSKGTDYLEVILKSDNNLKFATGLKGYRETPSITEIFTLLRNAGIFEILIGSVAVAPHAVTFIDITDNSIKIEVEGDGRGYTFMKNVTADYSGSKLVADKTWHVDSSIFADIETRAKALKEEAELDTEALEARVELIRSNLRSLLGVSEGQDLNTYPGSIIPDDTNVRDALEYLENYAEADTAARDAEVTRLDGLITAEEARVNALIASGMWLFANQSEFPAAADNHGRVVHSHADGAIFYAHGGMWHEVATEANLSTTIAALDAEALARAAADTQGLADANAYTDAQFTALIDNAPEALNTLRELGEALAQNEADSGAALTAAIASEAATRLAADNTLGAEIDAVQADVNQNESDSDAADAALSARLDVLEADPTTATALAAVQSDVDQNEADSDAADAALSGRLEVLEADPTTATAVAAVQSDVDQNEADGDAADAALSGRLDTLEADPTTATAVAAVQSDVDANEVARKAVVDIESNITSVKNAVRGTSISIGNNITLNPAFGGRVEIEGDLLLDNQTDVIDSAGVILTSFTNINAYDGRLGALEADPTTGAAVAAGDAATLSSANSYTDTSITNLVNGADAALDTLKEIGDALSAGDISVTDALTAQITTEATTRANADTALSGRLDTLEADPTTAAAVAAVQSDVDQNESDSDAADAALSGRLDVLEADPTTQALLDAEALARASADTALSGRLDTLEADPTTATAVAAVQADVDQNEADADAALALKAPLADPDFTGQLDVDTNARLEFDSNLTKVHNVLRGTSIVIGNNIQLNPAAAGGRVEIEGSVIIDLSEVVDAANDGDAATAGVQVGGVYRHGNDLKIRIV